MLNTRVQSAVSSSRAAGLPIGMLCCALLLVLPAGARAQTDCNGNGVADAEDINAGTSADANANGVPDECERC